jgi:hypothetical protein
MFAESGGLGALSNARTEHARLMKSLQAVQEKIPRPEREDAGNAPDAVLTRRRKIW